MNKVRLWAQIPWQLLFTSVIVVAFGLFAANPAGAQEQTKLVKLDHPVKVGDITCHYKLEGPLPSSSSNKHFSPWKNMHPHTFDGKQSSYVEQCKSTIGKKPWLTSKVCKDFGRNLQQGFCAVVPDVNDINLDVLKGKSNGLSSVFLDEHMQLKESRQAVFVSLPGNLWLGIFAGEQGKSCNNFFALKEKPSPPSVIPPPIPQTVTPVPRRAMVHTGPVQGSTVQYLPSVLLQNCCPACQIYIPSAVIVVEDGANLQSSGQTPVDW